MGDEGRCLIGRHPRMLRPLRDATAFGQPASLDTTRVGDTGRDGASDVWGNVGTDGAGGHAHVMSFPPQSAFSGGARRPGPAARGGSEWARAGSSSVGRTHMTGGRRG